MGKTFRRWSGAFVLAVGCLLGQETLTNDAVLKLVKAGLGEDLIIKMISSQPGKYRTGASDIVALKQAGVSDKVLAAMIAGGGGATTSSATTPAATAGAATTAAAAGPVTEVGVYWKKGDTWTELSPEVVNFKTGGVLKSIGTAGIVKGDINGRVNGPHSQNQVKSPLELLIYAPEGGNATEYQLLRLRDQKDAREFRTVTGGVLHVSGGATRDLMPFESKKIAPRTFVLSLPNIGPGEYGILPPAGGDATASSGRIGKIYSFRLIE